MKSGDLAFIEIKTNDELDYYKKKCVLIKRIDENSIVFYHRQKMTLHHHIAHIGGISTYASGYRTDQGQTYCFFNTIIPFDKIRVVKNMRESVSVEPKIRYFQKLCRAYLIKRKVTIALSLRNHLPFDLIQIILNL